MTATLATTDAIVRARVGADIKQRAGAALNAVGLTVSDAIRLLLVRVANEGRLPFDPVAPKAAMQQEAAQQSVGSGNLGDLLHAISRRNGVTKEDHEALMQALGEVDKPIAEPVVFEE